jgi:hypothetical protein
MADPEIAINNLTVVHPGGTVNFVEVTDDDKVFVGYCTAVRIMSFYHFTAEAISQNFF